MIHRENRLLKTVETRTSCSDAVILLIVKKKTGKSNGTDNPDVTFDGYPVDLRRVGGNLGFFAQMI